MTARPIWCGPVFVIWCVGYACVVSGWRVQVRELCLGPFVSVDDGDAVWRQTGEDFRGGDMASGELDALVQCVVVVSVRERIVSYFKLIEHFAGFLCDADEGGCRRVEHLVDSVPLPRVLDGVIYLECPSVGTGGRGRIRPAGWRPATRVGLSEANVRTVRRPAQWSGPAV